MSKPKMNFANLQGKLGRDEMSKIMAGSGNCQANNQSCSTANQLNCCSGLQCTNYKCGYPTIT
ncbi:hypothetical protein Lbys_1379 [Leadbetterella byssophila DSM 17132]|uniref:Uncharacterized protein n=1 Tax=Leadbetterella byssophila (strain DSM 17132 / JCM 16389 / KACC 11308 / NBRC 106382 / 4M15) TaxID=649349 RepID=E4RW62_LEAB4|nr:hypothetical protein Lbys_1379 [Leadbetterella byssophila DSM 17132]